MELKNSKPKTLEEARSRSIGRAISRVWRPVFEKPEKIEGFLPILMTGGIGDGILSLPMLDQIVKRVGEIRLYTLYPDSIAYFRPEYSKFIHTEPFPGFEYFLSIETVPRFRFGMGFKGFRESTPASELFLKTKMFATGPIERNIDYQPQFDYELWRDGMNLGLKRHTIGCKALGLDYVPRKKYVEDPIDLEPFITVHDGFDQTQTMVPYRATKTWNLRSWALAIDHVKKKFPKTMIVQLGGPMSRPIPGVDVNFAGRLKLPQSLNVLGRSKLHIDGDSGLVHAAHAMGVRSVVMFGPTPLKFFGYDDNENIEPNECGSCGWVNEDWMNECPLFETPRCMDSIRIGSVVAAIVKNLEVL